MWMTYPRELPAVSTSKRSFTVFSRMPPGFYGTHKLVSLTATSPAGFLPKGLRMAHFLTILDNLPLPSVTKVQF